MKDLWIFNPETEMALGAGSAYYTPPRRVGEIRKSMALFPVTFAGAGSAVLLLDAMPEDYKAISPDLLTIAQNKKIQILNPSQLEDWKEYQASPWGWNAMIRRILLENCPGLKGVPTEQEIKSLRNLAHRQTTIRFISSLPSDITTNISLPRVFDSADEAIDYYKINPNMFVKAPWSSSGRGVMRTDDLLPLHVEPWIRGVVRSQGAVIIEPIYDKMLDFATEWMIKDGKVNYLGVSVFEASGRGKYHKNFDFSQAELMDMINEVTSCFNSELIEAQSESLKLIIAQGYSGPVGIDMMVLRGGAIHPCVELNLRHTMGSVRLYSNSNF